MVHGMYNAEYMAFSIISVLILLASFAIQITLSRGKALSFLPKNREKMGLLLYVISVVFVLGFHIFLIFEQYTEWKEAGPPASFLVPPYRSIEYLFSYHFGRYFIYHLASFLASLGLLFFIKIANRRSGGKFFEDDEPYMASIPVFLLGYHAWNYLWVFYLLAIFVLGLLVSLISGKIRRGEERFSFYFLWIPLAIAGIIGEQFLILN